MENINEKFGTTIDIDAKIASMMQTVDASEIVKRML